MARLGLLVGLLCLFSGCVHTADDRVRERVRDYNEDGVLLFKKGEYEHARESFQAALALKPTDTSLQFNIGQCYDHLGQPERAEAAYQVCLKAEPNHTECRHELAVLLWKENRKADARKMVEDWLIKQPRLADALALHGWLFRQMGDLPLAQGRLQQALAIDGNNLLALIELAQVYEALNRPERAAFLLGRALEVKPDQPEIAHHLASLKARGVGRPRPD